MIAHSKSMDFSSPRAVVAKITSAIPGFKSNSTNSVQQLYDLAEHVVHSAKSSEIQSFADVFGIVEQSIIWGSQEVRDLMISGFLENLKNISAWQDFDYAFFEDCLGPETHVASRWLEKKWQGKSLADTIRNHKNQ